MPNNIRSAYLFMLGNKTRRDIGGKRNQNKNINHIYSQIDNHYYFVWRMIFHEL